MGKHKKAEGHSKKPVKVDRAYEAEVKAVSAMKYITITLVVLGVGQLCWSLVSALIPPYSTVAVSDSAALKNVFFSGAPHMVLCHNETTELGSKRHAGAAFDRFTRAAGTLQSLYPDPVQSVLLDCWQELPTSGVSTLTRFKLQQEVDTAVKAYKKVTKKTNKSKSRKHYPIAFTVSNGAAPKLIPLELLEEEAPGADLVDHIQKATRVKLLPVSSSDHVTQCVKKGRAGCLVLLVGPGALAGTDQTLSKWLGPVMREFRTTQFAVVNATKRELRSSPVGHLLAAGSTAPAGSPTTGMVLLQRGLKPLPKQEATTDEAEDTAAESSSDPDADTSATSGKKEKKAKSSDKKGKKSSKPQKPKSQVLATVTPGDVRPATVTTSAVRTIVESAKAALDAFQNGEAFLPAGTVNLGGSLPNVVKRSQRKSSSNSKRKKSTSTQSSSDDDSAKPRKSSSKKSSEPEDTDSRLRKAARRAERRKAKRKARHTKEAEAEKAARRRAGKGSDAEDETAVRERERAAREAMEKAAMESGHVPMAAVDVDSDGWTHEDADEEIMLEDEGSEYEEEEELLEDLEDDDEGEDGGEEVDLLDWDDDELVAEDA